MQQSLTLDGCWSWDCCCCCGGAIDPSTICTISIIYNSHRERFLPALELFQFFGQLRSPWNLSLSRPSVWESTWSIGEQFHSVRCNFQVPLLHLCHFWWPLKIWNQFLFTCCFCTIIIRRPNAWFVLIPKMCCFFHLIALLLKLLEFSNTNQPLASWKQCRYLRNHSLSQLVCLNFFSCTHELHLTLQKTQIQLEVASRISGWHMKRRNMIILINH